MTENDNYLTPGQVKFAISQKICFTDQIKISFYVKGGTHPYKYLKKETGFYKLISWLKRKDRLAKAAV